MAFSWSGSQVFLKTQYSYTDDNSREHHYTTERCLDCEMHACVCVYLIYANLCPDSGSQELRCLWEFRDYLQRVFFFWIIIIEMWHKSSKMVILSSKLILQEVFFYVSEKAVCNQKTLQNTCWFESPSIIPFNYCQLQKQPQFSCILYTSDKKFRKNWQLAVE